MNNSEIELELIQHFGLEKTILFCKMTSFMYKLLYEECLDSNPEDKCDFGYDMQWWELKYEELKTKSWMSPETLNKL